MIALIKGCSIALRKIGYLLWANKLKTTLYSIIQQALHRYKASPSRRSGDMRLLQLIKTYSKLCCHMIA